MDVERIKFRALPTERRRDSDDRNLPGVQSGRNLKFDALGTLRGPRCAVKCAERLVPGISQPKVVVLGVAHSILQIEDYVKTKAVRIGKEKRAALVPRLELALDTSFIQTPTLLAHLVAKITTR